MKKRILSMLLVIVMVIGLLPTVAQAAGGFSVTTTVVSGGGRLSYQNNLQSGQIVTLQPIPNQGYGVYSIEAEDRYHNRIQLTDLGNGCYTFTMPDRDVSVKVEFAEPVRYVDFLSNGKFTLEMGKTLDLKDKMYFSPAVYLPTRFTWSSDNNSVATVDSDGNVTAVGEGVANITVTAIDGTKTNGVSPSGSCKITVKKTSTITFDTDGGTTIAPITKAVGESFSVADPTKDGYTFAGWEPELPGYMPEENTNYTAQWTAKQYTITQDPNTNNGTLYFAKDYNYDEPVTAAAQGDTIAVFWEYAEGYVLDYETDISVRTEAGDAVEVESFEFTMPGDNVIVSASFVLEDYVIGVAASEGGKAEADKETAHMGDTVTVTAMPDTGYVVKRVAVTPVYNNGPEPCSLEEEGGEEPEEIAVTDKGDGTYSFIMPASNVAVNVEFELLTYDVWVGGVQITGANKDNLIKAINDANNATVASGGISYDPESKTLTLNNYSYTGAGYKYDDYLPAVIYTKNDLIVNLVGSNTLNCTGEGIYALGYSLTIQGNDKDTDALTVTSESNNIFAGNITIRNATITANNIMAMDSVSIHDSTVNTKDDADNTNSQIAAWGNLCVTSSTINFGGSNNMLSGAEVTITESTITTANGKSSRIGSEGSLEIDNSNVTVAADGRPAISADTSLTIRNSTVNATTTGTSNQMPASGIVAIGDIMVEGSQVTASGTDSGIFTMSDMSVSGSSTVTATATSGELAMCTMDDEGNPVPLMPNLTGAYSVTAGSDAENATKKDASAAATYANKYVKIVPGYTVKYVVGETEVHSETVAQGENVKNVPAVPAKEGYTGAWSADGKNITSDTTIHPVYTVNQYTISFDTDGGSAIAAITQDYGTAVTAPAEPSKTGYTFSGWEAAIPATMPAENMTVKAKWTINRYTVTYKADGEVVKTLTVEHGKDATAPEIPAKAGHTAAWDSDGKNITADTEINAVYTINKYTVTYKADGKVVKTVEVEHGKDATAPEIPAKEGYNETAPKWDKDGKNITADTEINAVYTINKYTVTYKADGKVVKTVEVEHGKDATAPEIPAKEGYNETAPKWDKDGKNITADTEINAVYTKNQPGEYADVTPDTNVGGGKVAEEIEELKEKVPFTQEEEKQIEYGADVEVWLEIKDISDSVSSEEKAKVEEKLGDADVALYLDIAMFKQVGENEASRLTQLSDKVQITFKLDDSYINTDKNVTRTYSIIHVHDGKAEVITPVFDANAKTLSFQTDRFSTYGVVYTDEKITPPTEAPTEAPTEKPTTSPDVPATGDSFQPAFWIACMTLSIFGIAVLLLDAKRRHAR